MLFDPRGLRVPARAANPSLTQRSAGSVRGRVARTTVHLLLTAIAATSLALTGLGAARPADAAGLRNCTTMDPSVGGSARAGCWEDVWSGGTEHRMTFATGCCTAFNGTDPGDLDRFYVIAPQNDPPQSLLASFRHDHVTRDIPAQNHGTYSVRLHGYFAICSPSGIASGTCVYELNSPAPGFTLPFAKTVNGQSLTSVEPLEAAVDAGLVTLIDTGAVIVGTIGS
jgi:hypothetical protein